MDPFLSLSFSFLFWLISINFELFISKVQLWSQCQHTSPSGTKCIRMLPKIIIIQVANWEGRLSTVSDSGPVQRSTAVGHTWMSTLIIWSATGYTTCDKFCPTIMDLMIIVEKSLDNTFRRILPTFNHPVVHTAAPWQRTYEPVRHQMYKNTAKNSCNSSCQLGGPIYSLRLWASSAFNSGWAYLNVNVDHLVGNRLYYLR